MIKVAFLIFTLALTRIGCEEPILPLEYTSSVDVHFGSGFQSDSVIVKIDNQVRLRMIGISDYSGCMLMMTEGLHSLELELPQLHIQGTAVFVARPERKTIFVAILDRSQNKIILENHTNSVHHP